jgi:hypothetical protein
VLPKSRWDIAKARSKNKFRCGSSARSGGATERWKQGAAMRGSKICAAQSFRAFASCLQGTFETMNEVQGTWNPLYQLHNMHHVIHGQMRETASDRNGRQLSAAFENR